MERVKTVFRTKYMASFLALLMLAFFVAWPAAAQGQDYRIEFRANETQITPGQCVNVYWDTDNVQAVYYQGQGVSGIQQTRVECPIQDTTYTLQVLTRDNQQILRTINVHVVNNLANNWENWNYYNQNNANAIISFWADRTQVRPGECLVLNWNTANVNAVYFQGQGVSGINQSQVECPTQDTTYTLTVVTRNNQQVTRQINVDVLDTGYNPNYYYNYSPNNPVINFWADRTQVRAGECLNIYWDTANVQAVYYEGNGVSGIGQNRVECPDRDTTYDLRVVLRNGQQVLRQIPVDVVGTASNRGDVVLFSGEMVDFDRNARVSGREDDFHWRWTGGEHGVLSKTDHSGLRLAVRGKGDTGDLNRLSENECRNTLNDHNSSRVQLDQQDIVCFRTDDGHYGKFRVDDIRSTNGRLALDWRLWD